MKITSKENKFQPYSITIQVQCKDDQIMLENLCLLNIGIPRLVEQESRGKVAFSKVQTFLKLLKNSLR